MLNFTHYNQLFATFAYQISLSLFLSNNGVAQGNYPCCKHKVIKGLCFVFKFIIYKSIN